MEVTSASELADKILVHLTSPPESKQKNTEPIEDSVHLYAKELLISHYYSILEAVINHFQVIQQAGSSDTFVAV